MSLIGIAISSVPRTARSAAPVANLPSWCWSSFLASSSLLPLCPRPLYRCRLFPAALDSGGLSIGIAAQLFQYVKPIHGWDHGQMALVLVIWCIVGLVLSARTFRWTGRTER